MAPLNSIKAGISSLPGVAVTKKLFTAVSTPLKNAFNDQTANIDDQKEDNLMRRMNTEQSIFLDIRDTLLVQNKVLMEGLAGMKDKGLMGLGVLAGLVARNPFAFLSGFFSQLAVELKLLKGLFGAGANKLAGYFKPLTNFFAKLKDTKLFKQADALIDGVRQGISGKFGGLVESIKKSKFVTSVDDLVVGIKNAFTTKFTALGTALKNNKVFMAIDDVVARFGGVGKNCRCI